MDRKTIERKLINNNERAADVRTSGRQERKPKNERRSREALPKMDDMKKGELLGYSKAMLDLKHQKERENEHKEAGE